MDKSLECAKPLLPKRQSAPALLLCYVFAAAIILLFIRLSMSEDIKDQGNVRTIRYGLGKLAFYREGRVPEGEAVTPALQQLFKQYGVPMVGDFSKIERTRGTDWAKGAFHFGGIIHVQNHDSAVLEYQMCEPMGAMSVQKGGEYVLIVMRHQGVLTISDHERKPDGSGEFLLSFSYSPQMIY